MATSVMLATQPEIPSFQESHEADPRAQILASILVLSNQTP